MRRLLGVAVSVLVHLALIAAVVALVRTAAPPVLFVDLAHGLDLAEQAVSDVRRAVADVRSRVLPRADAPRAKSEGAPRPAASASSPPSAPPAETRRVETPAPPVAPEPVRPAPEPSPPVASATPAPQPRPEPRVVELPPVASAAGDSAASASTTERASAPATSGTESGGRGATGAGVPGATAGDGGGQSSAGVRSGARDGSAVALAIPGTGGGDTAAADYAGYYNTLRQRLYESLAYPPIARRRGLTGTVLVDVEIDASGKIGTATVVTSSKHSVLDDAALDAVHGVGKVPFPPGVPPRRLRVRLPVVFDLR
jgi:protein TonB